MKDSVAIGKGLQIKRLFMWMIQITIIEPTAKITPQYKDGKVKADKR